MHHISKIKGYFYIQEHLCSFAVTCINKLSDLIATPPPLPLRFLESQSLAKSDSVATVLVFGNHHDGDVIDSDGT